jgi:hypothetical protein
MLTPRSPPNCKPIPSVACTTATTITHFTHLRAFFYNSQIWSLKQNQAQEQAKSGKPKVTAAQLRVQKGE